MLTHVRQTEEDVQVKQPVIVVQTLHYLIPELLLTSL